MTPSERERRIDVAAEYLEHAPKGLVSRDDITAMLDAADAAVPMIAKSKLGDLIGHLERDRSAFLERAERAEVAARDLYTALEDFLDGKYENDGAYQRLHDVLSRRS